VSFGQHRQQRMMTRPAVFARVVSLQRAFLLSVALEHSRVQIETVAFGAQWQAVQFPPLERFEQPLHVAHAEPAEQVADGIVGGKPLHAQQSVQRLVPAQPGSVSEAPGAGQHRDQETNQRCRWVNLMARQVAHGHVLPQLAAQIDPVQVLHKNRQAAERSHCARRLAQLHTLACQ
jgi:hypothetical protein